MATQEQLDKLRRSIGDSIKEHVEQLTGDGYTLLFPLEYRNVQNTSLQVDGNATAIEMVYQGSGQIQLAEAPAEGAKLVVKYEYAAFTDAVLSGLIDTNGVDGAIIEALKDLLASASRRADYIQGQTNVKASQVFSNLKDLLNMYLPGGSLSTESGSSVSVGSRTPQVNTPQIPREDLSRSDNFSDNNVG